MKDLLIDEINKWSEKYSFSFQFTKGINNVSLFKDDVELYSSFGHETVEDVMMDVLNYIYRVNRVPLEKRFNYDGIAYYTVGRKDVPEVLSLIKSCANIVSKSSTDVAPELLTLRDFLLQLRKQK